MLVPCHGGGFRELETWVFLYGIFRTIALIGTAIQLASNFLYLSCTRLWYSAFLLWCGGNVSFLLPGFVSWGQDTY